MQKAKLTQDAILNTSGTLIYFFCQWLLTVFAVRLGSYSCAGVFSLALAFSNIFSYIGIWGVRGVQVSDISMVYQNGDYAGTRIITNGLAILVFPVVLFCYGYSGELAWCCVAAVFYKVLESISDLYFGTMQRVDRYDWIAISYTLKGVLPTAAFVLLLKMRGSLLFSLLSMSGTYLAILLLYDAPLLRNYGLFKPQFKKSWELMKKCLPLMLNGVVSAWLIYLPRHTVQKQLGDEILGYYGSISTVVVVLSTLGGAVWAALMPSMSANIQNKDVAKVRKLLKVIYAVMGGIAVISLVFGNLLGPWAFDLIYGGTICKHMYLLSPVILNAVFLMADTFYDCIFIPMGRQRFLLLANVAGLLLCAVSADWATKMYGAIGACCSMTAGLVLRFLILFIQTERSICSMNKVQL